MPRKQHNWPLLDAIEQILMREWDANIQNDDALVLSMRIYSMLEEARDTSEIVSYLERKDLFVSSASCQLTVEHILEEWQKANPN